MNRFNNFQVENGEFLRFTQKHPNESFAGHPGIYALTLIHDFERHPVVFEPTEDLSEADIANLRDHDLFEECSEYSVVGVAICIMPKSTAAARAKVARVLNDRYGLDLAG